MLQQDAQLMSAVELDPVGEPPLERSETELSRVPTTRQLRGRVAPLGVRVSVVIAAMNEAENLPYVFSRLPEGLHEVILVDGHSVDDTVAVARKLRPDIRILAQPGRGKGNAMAEGFSACTGEIIVALDADGSTDPAEIPRFV